MSSTIAVVGAGPGLGRSIARRFGLAGHPVALISRNQGKLEAIAASLRGEGITAGVFPADVTDEAGLTGALSAAASELGRIGVMSYSPAAIWDHAPGRVPDLAAMGITSALETTPASARAQFELLTAGALAASGAVLPAMRQAGDGALLLTTGMSAMVPIAMMGSTGIALAGLRSWAAAVHDDLAKDGMYVGHVSIGLPIIPGSGEGDPDAIAERWFQLAQARDTFEVTIGF
jgi:NAD(P)-dependent dehydrogenase (short-subunit alcohol dehydrogenase family)